MNLCSRVSGWFAANWDNIVLSARGGTGGEHTFDGRIILVDEMALDVLDCQA